MPATLAVRPGVETLGDRLVPAVLDLTTAGAEALLDSGAIVRQTDAQPTGTGHIRSFVRLQGAAPGGGGQQGYNTEARPLQFDENKSPQFTRSLTLGQVPVVVVNGVAYREFLLDVNQKTSARFLSVDEVRVYLGSVASLTGYDAAARTLAGLGAVYDLDSNGDVSVRLNAALNAGSGSGDMKLLIPNAAFAGASLSDFVYLYSKMGAQAGATANGGFEEWAVRSLPAPGATGTASLSGRVFFDENQNGALDDGFDFALQGVTIHLRGVNDLGQTVDLVTTTDENGAYKFTGLRAGEYSVWETQPGNYGDGSDYVGSAGGALSTVPEGELGAGAEDAFVQVFLLDGAEATDYTFTERSQE
jgi:hypothetical protein